MRIAVLADLHVGSPFNGIDKLDRVISLTEHARPDLILLAGDYVIRGVLGGTFTPPEAIAASLQKLSAPQGVFACSATKTGGSTHRACGLRSNRTASP